MPLLYIVGITILDHTTFLLFLASLSKIKKLKQTFNDFLYRIGNRTLYVIYVESYLLRLHIHFFGACYNEQFSQPEPENGASTPNYGQWLLSRLASTIPPAVHIRMGQDSNLRPSR